MIQRLHRSNRAESGRAAVEHDEPSTPAKIVVSMNVNKAAATTARRGRAGECRPGYTPSDRRGHPHGVRPRLRWRRQPPPAHRRINDRVPPSEARARLKPVHLRGDAACVEFVSGSRFFTCQPPAAPCKAPGKMTPSPAATVSNPGRRVLFLDFDGVLHSPLPSSANGGRDVNGLWPQATRCRTAPPWPKVERAAGR